MMDDKEILEQNIKDFREIADDLRGCMQEIAGNRNKFACIDCPNIGDCIEYLHMALSLVCDWMADFMEGGTDRFIERGKMLIDKSMEESENKKGHNIYS